MAQQIIATGSLYLDRDETLAYALDSVKRVAAQNPTEYYYDVICRVDQIELACKCLARVAKEIERLCPQIIDEAKHLGITTNEWVRPGMISAVQAHGGGDIQAIDINPERKSR